MTSSYSVECPVCKRRVVVTGLTASCGTCAVVTGASDAKETWNNVEGL